MVAAKEVLDRAWGKASARLEVTQGEPELTSGMSMEQKVATLSELRSMLAERESSSRPAALEVEAEEVVHAP